MGTNLNYKSWKYNSENIYIYQMFLISVMEKEAIAKKKKKRNERNEKICRPIASRMVMMKKKILMQI